MQTGNFTHRRLRSTDEEIVTTFLLVCFGISICYGMYKFAIEPLFCNS